MRSTISGGLKQGKAHDELEYERKRKQKELQKIKDKVKKINKKRYRSDDSSSSSD